MKVDLVVEAGHNGAALQRYCFAQGDITVRFYRQSDPERVFQWDRLTLVYNA